MDQIIVTCLKQCDVGVSVSTACVVQWTLLCIPISKLVFCTYFTIPMCPFLNLLVATLFYLNCVFIK